MGFLFHDGAAHSTPVVGSPDTATADPPILRPKTTPCTVPLFSGYTFADFSPKSFSYTPPAHCSAPFAKVVFEADFAVTAGRQFDRTANIWIGGTNVYFGTTQEPSRTVSPTWHVERDLTDLSALFSSPQAGEVDLGNLVDGTYTGVISGSAVLKFYPLEPHAHPPRTADVVLPLSAGPTGGTVALSTTGSRLARSFSLPKNIERAYLDVFAQSQSQDEFWYTCVPNDVMTELQSCGATSFRETEITIDGQPAGVAPIYPWIYTGGMDPYLWRPIPGVQTLNFLPYRVDLTPFAGVLSDGHPHEVAIGVFNANNNFATTGTLLLFLDSGSRQVTGAVTKNTLSSAPAPAIKENLTTAMDGTISGTVTVRSARVFTLAGYVHTSHGKVVIEVAQDLHFSSQQQFTIGSTQYIQNIRQETTLLSVTQTEEGGHRQAISEQLSFPLMLDFSYVTNADMTSAQTTTVKQKYERAEQRSREGLPIYFSVVSNSVSPTDTLTFDAGGSFLGNRNQTSTQSYFSADSSGDCYSRTLTAAGGLLSGITHGRECGR